jgi:hypothetical protein
MNKNAGVFVVDGWQWKCWCKQSAWSQRTLTLLLIDGWQWKCWCKQSAWSQLTLTLLLTDSYLFLFFSMFNDAFSS